MNHLGLLQRKKNIKKQVFWLVEDATLQTVLNTNYECHGCTSCVYFAELILGDHYFFPLDECNLANSVISIVTGPISITGEVYNTDLRTFHAVQAFNSVFFNYDRTNYANIQSGEGRLDMVYSISLRRPAARAY